MCHQPSGSIEVACHPFPIETAILFLLIIIVFLSICNVNKIFIGSMVNYYEGTV